MGVSKEQYMKGLADGRKFMGKANSLGPMPFTDSSMNNGVNKIAGEKPSDSPRVTGTPTHKSKGR